MDSVYYGAKQRRELLESDNRGKSLININKRIHDNDFD